MKRLRPDIVSIEPIIEGIDREEELAESLREKSMEEMFKDYFIKEKGGLEPSAEIMELFLSIAYDAEVVENETSKS
jgi:exonuclease SbcD